MRAVGLPVAFQDRKNPLPWMNAWLVSDNVQVAPQESEISSYLVGQVDTAVSDGDFDEFEF
jgi:ribonucleoside-diphosphate reductase beta chain